MILYNTKKIKTNENNFYQLLYIHISNTLDMNSTTEFNLIVNTIVKGGIKTIILDLERLDYIDSSGISVFVNTTKTLRQIQGDLVMINVPEKIFDILDLVKFQDFIHIYPDFESAIKHFEEK